MEVVAILSVGIDLNNFIFFFNDTATTEIYTLSLHDALPIFITKDGANLKTIQSGAVIGTSSLRRAVQVSRIRQDVVVKPVRGNIETRVNKVTDGKFDAVILAEAGISRLGLDVKHSILSTKDFPPSPGQGALAIVCRADDEKTISMLKKIEDEKSRNEIEIGRASCRERV